jgi:subtilase family serine protease
VATLSGLAVAAAALTGSVTSAAAGVMTPAIGTQPHYVVAGQIGDGTSGVTFKCQLTTPAGCYGPAQIRAAYGVDKVAATGAGRTIVIVDAFQSPTIAHDLATFDAVFGLPAPTFNIIAPDGITPFDQTNPDQVGWAGEITLDVEWAHAIAPGATIDLVLSRSDQDADILSAQRYAITNDLGDTLSQSFGEAEQCMDPAIRDATHALFAQAVGQGMTVFASSGDQGAALPTCDGSSFVKAASTPASDPNVTGVGGTALDADGITGAYHGETVWNEPRFEAAGGGGFSAVFGTPSYQRSMHLPSRGVPDVAYNAAIIGGVLAVWSSSGQGANLVFRFGGTSAGSPQWAALIALADQLAGQRLGEINNELYAWSHGPRYPTLFHDVTTGDNTFHGPVTVTGFPAGTGWDPATGLGTPRADALLPRLAGLDG